ncbi:hypothetical protein KIL84_015199 [Mauremys mutica]|uniref:Uncharacterized protein n=1 Tax=Mauremys mutica TaxID=74926 RepID=A0A9D3WQ15_9SAUR|nr:hypothetical protein KIL84_015199 [Mauremys mutica]
MIDPMPQIPPGSSGSSVFVKTSYTPCGSIRVLSYECKAFILAIMFSNPFDRRLYSSEFAIELFTGRKHFGSMESRYHYMYSYGPPYTCKSYRKVKLEVQDGQLEVTSEENQVKATMSKKDKSIIKVQIEQKDPCPAYTAYPANPGSPWKFPNEKDKGAAGGK